MLSFSCVDDADNGSGRHIQKLWQKTKPTRSANAKFCVFSILLPLDLCHFFSTLFAHYSVSAAYKINEQICAFWMAMTVHFSYFYTYLFFFYFPLYLASYSFGRFSLIWKYSIYNGIMIHFNRISFSRFASTTNECRGVDGGGERVFVIETIHFFSSFVHVPLHTIHSFIHIL